MNKLDKAQNKRFDKKFPEFKWAGSPFPIFFKKTPNRNHIKRHLADELARDRKKHKRIYRWLLGYTDFPTRKKDEGVYYWRTHLLKKLQNHDKNDETKI